MGKHMTIAMGLRYKDGIILAADTQVTIPGDYKMGQSKLRLLRTNSCVAAFALAGDMEFTERSLEIIEQHLNDARPSLPDVREALDAACLQIKEKYRAVADDPYRPLSLQLVTAIKIKDSEDIDFLKLSGPVVTPGKHYTFIGSGESLAEFLLRNAYQGPKASKESVVRSAAYILFHVKRHVDGCGGISQFLAIDKYGETHPFADQEFEHEDLGSLEKSFAVMDNWIRNLVPKFVDHSINDAAFEQEVERIKAGICRWRKGYMAAIKESEQDAWEQQISAYKAEGEENGGES